MSPATIWDCGTAQDSPCLPSQRGTVERRKNFPVVKEGFLEEAPLELVLKG